MEKNDINFIFNSSLLEEGDILLMDTYHARQRAKMPDDRFLHAAIYIGNNFIVEADGLGVIMNKLLIYGFKKQKDACVLRLKQKSNKIDSDIVLWVRKQLGMEYGAREALVVPKKKNTQDKESSNRTFCSRLVAQAYENAGVKLVQNSDYCSPDDFLESDGLNIVSNALREVNDETRQCIMNNRNNVDERSFIDFMLPNLLSQMSSVYSVDIQTFDQLIFTAISKSKNDKLASSTLMKQDWMMDPKEQTSFFMPWLDDNEKFLEHFTSTENILFFLYNQFLYYDNTYIPIFRENVVVMTLIRIRCHQSQVIRLIHKQTVKVLNEALRVRKRLEYLYVLINHSYKENVLSFKCKYNIDLHYEYQERELDFSKLYFLWMENICERECRFLEKYKKMYG